MLDAPDTQAKTAASFGILMERVDKHSPPDTPQALHFRQDPDIKSYQNTFDEAPTGFVQGSTICGASTGTLLLGKLCRQNNLTLNPSSHRLRVGQRIGTRPQSCSVVFVLAKAPSV